tara:strand:+ start:792 stop:917 length:126 start_codon:yes stop_codon:yes gene_type:complete
MMQDSLLSIVKDAMAIIEAMGRRDVAEILQKRVNDLMGWEV